MTGPAFALEPSDPHAPWGTAPGMRSRKGYLGSARVPDARWARAWSPYTWALWRHWAPPKPLAIETPAEVNRRLCRLKPAGYTWTIEPARSRGPA